ncbi:MAG: hypothetical protein AAF494_00695 [Pseudomonadota bacterium]
MDNNHRAWLAAASAAGQGGLSARAPSIYRGRRWSAHMKLEGDFSGDAFTGAIARDPNDGDSLISTMSVTPGPFSNGQTTLTLLLAAATTAIYPASTDGSNVLWAVFEIVRTPVGRDPYTMALGFVPIVGRVGNA